MEFYTYFSKKKTRSSRMDIFKYIKLEKVVPVILHTIFSYSLCSLAYETLLCLL